MVTIPAIQEYAQACASKKDMGEDGYQPEKGLNPVRTDQLNQVLDDVKNLTKLVM